MEGPRIRILSTKSQLEEFKNSLVWEDLKYELNAWIESFELEQGNIVDDAKENNPSTAAVLMHLGDINGRKKASRYALAIPDVLIQILKEKENDSGRKQADGSDGS